MSLSSRYSPALLASLLLAAAAVAQDTADVEIATGVIISTGELVDLCESCHGPNGVSDQEDIPSLAGQSVDSIMEALEKFQFQQRHCPATELRHGEHDPETTFDMCHISASMSRTEKTALAEYFSEQNIEPPVVEPRP